MFFSIVDCFSLVGHFPLHEYVVTYSAVDEYSGCFQFSGILENSVVNLIVHASWSHVCACLLEICLEVEFLCHRLHLDSILKVNSKGFPEVVVPIYGPNCL